MDGSHADLITQIADGNVQNALTLQLFKQDILLCFQLCHVQTRCVVVNAVFICAGTFHADDSGRMVSVNDFLRLLRRKGGIIRKNDDPHRNRNFPKLLHILPQVQPHAGGKLADGLIVGLGADDNGLDPKRQNQRTAQQGRTDDAVHLCLLKGAKHKAGHDVYNVAILHRLGQFAGGVHGGRPSRIFPGSVVKNFADTIAPGIQIRQIVQTLSQIAKRQFLLCHMDSFFTKQITARAASGDGTLAVATTLAHYCQKVNAIFGLLHNYLCQETEALCQQGLLRDLQGQKIRKRPYAAHRNVLHKVLNS